ncbi:MAG: hypothetical protein ABSD99_10075 [Candidatus Bathyarchaeia archaeon]|jgi:hypothetical protein
MKKSNALAILSVVIGLGGLVLAAAYSAFVATPTSYQSGGYSNQGMMGQLYQPLQTSSNTQLTLAQAETIAQQNLALTGNSNLAVKEIMEFQYNFYVIYYEKDTGRGAFEMLIWKQVPPSGMMGGGMMYGRITVGIMMPEPGPNMIWNTKYSPMNNGMMGYYGNQWSSTMSVLQDEATQLAQTYLTSNFSNAKVEMGTRFYGYYTFDFTVNGKIAGMLSVNGSTGQVWYHSWHGDFIQEVEFT